MLRTIVPAGRRRNLRRFAIAVPLAASFVIPQVARADAGPTVTADIDPSSYATGTAMTSTMTAMSPVSGRELRYLLISSGNCPTQLENSGATTVSLDAGVETTVRLSTTAAGYEPLIRLCAWVAVGNTIEAAADDVATKAGATPTLEPEPTITMTPEPATPTPEPPTPTPTPTPVPSTPSPSPLPAAPTPTLVPSTPTPTPVVVTPGPTPTPVVVTPGPTATPTPRPGATPVPTAAPTLAPPVPTATPAPTAVRPPQSTVAPIAAPVVDALVARLVAPADDSEQFDRLHLRWHSEGEEPDEIWIWDQDPASGAVPVFVETTDSDDVFNSSLGNGDTVADIAPFLGFRKFWWRVKSTDDGRSAVSETRTVRVVPSPLDRSSAKATVKYSLTKSSKRPGTVRLRITASPRARVHVTVRHNGRVFATRGYTASIGTQRGFDFTLSCSNAGAFPYTVEIRDPYGNKATRRGQWSLSASRCATLRAAEQRKAAARKPKPSSGGGSAPSSGSSNCDPNYSGACLTPGIGDYDCAGGSGDGPNYVSGPISVTGSDPYDLDRDGDGVACES